MNSNKVDLRLALSSILDDARAIVGTADAERRRMTEEEAAQVETILASAEPLKRQLEMAQTRSKASAFDGPATASGDLFAAMKASGWNHEAGRTHVVVPFSALRKSGAVFDGDMDDLAPRRTPTLYEPFDRRFFYPSLKQQSVGGDVTSVRFLKESERTLASPQGSGDGPMVRAIDETSPKPTSSVKLELASEPLYQVAHLVEDVPLIVAAQSEFSTVINTALSLGLQEALDELAFNAVAMAMVPGGGSAATVEDIRHAVTVIRAAGFQPDTLVLSPEDAESLELTTVGSDNLYLFSLRTTGNASPLFGLTIRESKSATTPLVFDSSAFATLYTSPVSIQSDGGGDNFKNNTLVFRAELNATAVVEQLTAAYVVGGGS
jgi:hypothetical protein